MKLIPDTILVNRSPLTWASLIQSATCVALPKTGVRPLSTTIAITVNAGMNGYLTKLMQIRDLNEILAELLTAPIAGLIVKDRETTRKSTSFRELADILGGDEERLNHVLGVFERSTRDDCDLLDAAYAARDRKRVCELAHKLKSGCSQLGEDIAAQELEALEIRTKGGMKFDEEFVAARRELRQALTRVSTHLGTC